MHILSGYYPSMDVANPLMEHSRLFFERWYLVALFAFIIRATIWWKLIAISMDMPGSTRVAGDTDVVEVHDGEPLRQSC